MNHTPGPWKIVTYNNGKGMAIEDEKGNDVLTKSNAQFIVTACNAHEELVKQLGDLADMVSLTLSEVDDTQTGWYYQLQQHMQQSRKLLTTIKEGA